MTYTKKIVCLANSRKMSGRCLAGKEYNNNQNGKWIRPISRRPTHEISEEERRFKDGVYPEVLDIITIPMLQHEPFGYQQENYLINTDEYWRKTGEINSHECLTLLDSVENELWINGFSSSNGLNDKIPERLFNKLSNSLLLIQPNDLIIRVKYEYNKRKIRACFSFNNYEYKLTVTDPKIEKLYLQREDGEYNFDVNNPYMCISLGELFQNYCYKLVASIIYKNNDE